MRASVLFLLLPVTGTAEPAFRDLATDRTGSALYFSTSLRLRDSLQWAVPKIFVWTAAAGVQLYREPDSVSMSDRFSGGWESNHYRLTAPEVSADGGVTAYTAAADCNTGTPCVYSFEKYRAAIRKRDGAIVNASGGVAISPNGRYALLVSSRVQERRRLLDLETMKETPLEPAGMGAPPYRHAVANDGTVAFPAMTDEAGRRRVFLQRRGVSPSASLQLAGLDVSTGATRILAESTAQLVFDISLDASSVVYAAAGQAWVVSWDGSGRKQIVDLPDRVSNLALSGDGSVLFLATDANRILRIDVATLQVREIVPRTASAQLSVRALSRYAALRSLYGFSGDGLPVVDEIKVGRLRLPVLRSNPRELLFQAPFAGDGWGYWVEMEIRAAAESPFASTAVAGPFPLVDGTYPAFIADAIHSDFSDFVTDSNPARPGEVIHLYGVGFGPVDRQPEYGEAAPPDPPAALVRPVSCLLQSQLVETLFSGLAPGMTGLYQIDVRLPAVAPGDEASITCGAAARRLPVR